MRKTTAIGSALLTATALVLGGGAAASAASAVSANVSDPSGLYFFDAARNVVAHYPAPPAGCTPVPSTATLHAAWGAGFSRFQFFNTADCTGSFTVLDTLRSYSAERFKSFVPIP
ncbi:hypothetical protein AB0G15_20365 [Streptosporangium sp. NPDC023825]|uniref:hypothetical protein n=1 Tax=Streptosporangium sp. NPDC023825 TaxID=3154909 RepID=UPI003426259C